MKTKLYQIYDGENSNLFSDNPEIEAKTGKEAIMIFLKKTNRKNYKIKRSKNNDVIFKAQAFYYKNGNRYSDGNAIWYRKMYINE